jgi:hypothetical protein
MLLKQPHAAAYLRGFWLSFVTKTLALVLTEMCLHVLAYGLKRVTRILGIVRCCAR